MFGFEFYRIYHPLHLHFTSGYNCIKYNKRLKTTSKEHFEKRKDKHIFESWSRSFFSEEKCGQFIIANFINNSEDWLYLNKQDAGEIYLQWKQRRNNPTLQLKNDLDALQKIMEEKNVESFKQLLQKTPKGNKPPLLQLMLVGSISKESTLYLDGAFDNFVSLWQSWYELDPYVNSSLFKLVKYKPFIKEVDRSIIMDTFKEAVKENG